MEKFPGKIKTSVFISGRGSNLYNLINFSKKKVSPISINLIISNNKKAKGINYAKSNKIPYFITNFENHRKSEKQIIKRLKKFNIKLICLAGFMKILSSNFIKSFNNPILNIHPSLLPKYKGLNTHQRALKNREKFSGATVHLVNSKLDSGKVIIQKKVRILKKDDEKTLKQKVLRVEHQIYPQAIKKYYSNP